MKTAISINVASWRSSVCLKISKLGAVAALAGRLFQLAIVRGKKAVLDELLSDYGELKTVRMRVSGGSHQGYKLGEEVQGDYAM